MTDEITIDLYEDGYADGEAAGIVKAMNKEGLDLFIVYPGMVLEFRGPDSYRVYLPLKLIEELGGKCGD